MLSAQAGITTMLWMVIKCYDLMPLYNSFVCAGLANNSILALFQILPCAVGIGSSSAKFVESKRATYH